MKIDQLSYQDVLSLLPDRLPDSHKGNYGRVLLLCGCRGYTGAAALAAMGALRTGAGLVYLAVPESIYAIEAVKLTEAIVLPLPEENGKFSSSAAKEVCALMKNMDAVLIGPGIGRSEGTLSVLDAVLTYYHGPVAVDADGINLLCGHKDILRGRSAPTVLTPHAGEFERLYGRKCNERVHGAAEMATDLGAVVVLKGHNTVITDGVRCYMNPTGNPGMAVGGSGDVLAGMITALLGIGLTTLEAAACGAYLHGAAGDLCAEEMGQYAMLPSDMLSVLPRLLK